MKVCYFGIYNREYSRNKILISGLRQNAVEVIECRTDKKGFSKYWDLIKKHQKLKKDYDVMVVGYPGFQPMILAKLLTPKPIIFDAFVSLYDSIVLDRAQVKKNSFKAWYFWWLDKLSMSFADLVLFDTEAHIKFASTFFKINPDKFRRIFVGADTEVFYPREKKDNNLFKVSFYGHFIPLQGIETIVGAAKILENEKEIIFEIIGEGQEKKKILKLASDLGLKNINFLGNLSLEELANKMSEAEVCLGIFGNTPKTQRVIPNKVYECVALKKPVITGDTPAIRELFNEQELFLVPIASPELLAEKILKLKANPALAEEVAERGFKKLLETVSVPQLGAEFKDLVYSLRNQNEV